jgi:hypothetical protein
VSDSRFPRPSQLLGVLRTLLPKCLPVAEAAVLLVACMVLVGCERTIAERCETASSEACCLLSSAEAEAPLSSVVQRSAVVREEHWSSCRYETEGGEFAELVFFPEGGRQGTFAAKTRTLLETGRLRHARRMAVPNFTAEAFWVTNAAFPDDHRPALFVITGSDFFRVSATPLGQGFPDWKRPRELARSVLRNLEARRRDRPTAG